jgi:hypothetical protein
VDVVLDFRDPHEVQVSRGMLEFRADPGSGGRAALAGKTLQDMGYTAVFNICGFKESDRTCSNHRRPAVGRAVTLP